MRRDRFLLAYPAYIPSLLKRAQKWFDYDEAKELVSQITWRIVEQKTYAKIRTDKLSSFLHKALMFAVQQKQMRQEEKAEKTIRLDLVKDRPDASIVKTATVEEINIIECPFCFQGNLNLYGGCILCRTIVPSYITIHRKRQRLDNLSLAVTFDFNKKIDVHKAIAKLTPHEQAVVIAVGLGNESLESFAELSGTHSKTLLRTWLRAKEKLQIYLHEYSVKTLSKRGEKAFRHALQGIDITS